MISIAKANAQFLAFFNVLGLAFHEVYIDRICSFLGTEGRCLYDPVHMELEMQRTSLNQEFKERFIADSRRMPFIPQ